MSPEHPAPGPGVPRERAEGVDEVASGRYLQPVISVGLKVLKNKLSEYVRLAAGGETILITDRERVVAELVPPSPTRGELVADAVLAQAVRDGLVTPATLGPGAPPATEGVTSLREVLAGLEQDRRER